MQYRIHDIIIIQALALAAFCAVSPATGFRNAAQCRSSCGNQTIKYPFGLEEGCGRPEYQLTCNEDNNITELRLSSKVFTVNYVDYVNNKMIVRDDHMSDCSGLKQEEPGFRLDSTGTNYSITESTVLLLNCLAFQKEIQVNPLNSQYDCRSPACVAFVTSCLMNVDGPTTCCELMSPANLDLQPLQCQSYTSAYSPGKPMYDATKWSYGLVLEWDCSVEDLRACEDCQKSDGICGYGVDQNNFLCICDYGNSSDRCTHDCFNNSCTHAQRTVAQPGKETPRTKTTRLIAGSVVGAAIITASFIGLLRFIFLSGMKKQARIEAAETGSNDSFTNEETNNELLQIVLQHIESSPLTLFSYNELREATNSFSETRLLGDGGHGIVYEAKFSDGRVAAVKTLNYQNHRRFEQFDNEVRILAKVNHPNLVRLLGFCLEGRDLILVYELLPNGTLEEHLLGFRGQRKIPWETRITIAIEVAGALAYLHTNINPPIFHRDVKSSNVLLDDEFHAKLADFGLSRVVPMEATHVSTAPQGTLGYLDPEYHQTFRLTDKSDVYSFGVVLMEMISSRRAVDLTRSRDEVTLAALAMSKMQKGSFHDMVDPCLQAEGCPAVKETVDKVAELGFRCLAPSRNERPRMTEVVAELQRIRPALTAPKF